jgi:hypothetical protein
MILRSVCLLVVLVLAVPALAKPFSTFITVTSTAKIGSLTLEPGEYKIVANESSAKIFKGKKELGEVSCSWTEGTQKAYVDTLIYTDGKITELRLGGKTRILKFQ